MKTVNGEQGIVKRKENRGRLPILRLFLVSLFTIYCSLFTSPAFADCSSPTGLKGEIIYNDDYDTMQFCDDVNWVSMSASGTAVESDPQVDTLTASKWCKANAGGTAIDCASTTVPATSSGSDGYVQFSASGTLGSDSAFFWDNTNKRLGIGTASPTTKLVVNGSTQITGISAPTAGAGVELNYNGSYGVVQAYNRDASSYLPLQLAGSSIALLNGNVGIGTASPSTKLDVVGTLNASGAVTFGSTLGVTGAVTAASFSGGVGTALTALNASNLGSGTIPDARFPATLPAASGVNLTALNASNLASGTVAVARLGSSGTASSTTFLRGDNSWSALTAAGSTGHVQFNSSGVFAGSANLFWDSSNTRLGIGTAAPAYPLEVAGKAKSNTVLLLPGAGGAPTGTGSATYWNQGGSDLYYMTGNVGIGTATPAVKLDVVGSQNLSGNLGVGGTLNSVGNFSVATSKFFVNASSGDIGIGTVSPAAKLDVAGAIVSRVNNAGSGTAIDWSTSNVAYTSASCGAMTFTNMQDGGSYTLVVTGATAATCSFSQAGVTFKLPVGHGATTVSKHTVYSFIRAGSNVYVTWIPGF